MGEIDIRFYYNPNPNPILGFYFEYEKQIGQISSKSVETKAGMIVVMNWTLAFKDLIILAASRHENPFIYEHASTQLKLWDSILFILERNRDIKMITKAMSKCLSVLAQNRSFREHLESNQIESFFSFCVRFFLDDSAKGETEADRRPECMDLSVCLSVLITSSKNKTDMLNNSSKLLKLIQKYVCLYKVENNATEYFLAAAQKLLFLIDVNNLNLSYRFLNHILWRLLDLIKSKNENTRNLVINLLRTYISIGSFRPDIEGEEPKSKQLTYESIRIQKEILNILENTPMDIPIEYLFILETNNLPSCEKIILPQHICYNWSLLNLAADLSWLILQSEDQGLSEAMDHKTEESAEKDFQGIGSRKKLKLDWNPKARILSFFTSSKLHMNVTGVQLAIIMLVRHETVAEKIIGLCGGFLETFVASYDHPLAFASCIFFSKVFTIAPELAKKCFNLKIIWESAFSFLSISKRKSNSVYGLFSLLMTFIVNKLPSTDQILALMNVILSMEPWWFAVEDFLPFFAVLLSLGNLWNRFLIRPLTISVLNALHYFCQNNIPEHCVLIPKLLLLIMEISTPSKKLTSEWFNASLFTSIAPSYYLFDTSFTKFQQRVLKSSGFYGKDLIAEIINAMNQKKIPMISKRYNDVRIDIFLNCLDNFLTDVKDRIGKESILSFFFTINIVIHLIPSEYFEKKQQVLQQLSQVQTMASSGLFDKESVLAILSPFANQNWSLGKLTSHFEDQLLQIILKSAPIKDIEEDAMDFSDVTISKTSDVLKLSTYDDSIDIVMCLAFEKEVLVCSYLALILNNKLHIRNYMMKKLSESTIIALLVFGSHWEKLDIFIKEAGKIYYYFINIFLEFSICVLEWFTDSFSSFKFEKNPMLHASCIRFLSRASLFPIFSSHARISELAIDLINYFCEYCLTASSELREEFCILLCNLIPLTESTSISQLRPVERCWSLLDMKEFNFRFFFAKIVVPILLKNTQENLLLERGFQILKDNVLYSGNTEVESIGAAMIYSAFFLHCIPLRPDVFAILCLIASDHPALDTIESITQTVSEYYSCSSLNGPGISMIYFDHVLSSFNLESLSDFPYFLFGAATEDDFRLENMESINLALARANQFCSIPVRSIEKSFSKLYAEYVLSEDVNLSNQVIINVNKFFISIVDHASIYRILYV